MWPRTACSTMMDGDTLSPGASLGKQPEGAAFLQTNLVHNEKTKLTATWINSLASGSLLVGVATPTAAVIYGPSQMTAPSWAAGLAGLVFILVGLALHLLARALLEGLKE